MLNEKNSRWHLLDTLRGFTLLHMVMFHFLYDVFIIYGVHPGWDRMLSTRIWQQYICWSFILISGIAFHFSHSIWRKSLILITWGFVFTGVTVLLLPSETIWFGILSFMGLSALVTGLLDPILSKVPPALGILLSGLCFFFTRSVPSGYFGWGSLRLASLPRSLYRWWIGAWIGFPPSSFHSSDYFALIPWIFLFWIGYYLFDYLQKEKIAAIMKKGKLPLLTAIGRKSLWIYVIHQPICMLICILLFNVFLTTL